jgi:glutathione S-transferase
MITADLCRVRIEEEITISQSAFYATFDQAKLFKMTLPALEVEIEGEKRLLSGSLTIAKYIAALNGDGELLGVGAFEKAQVDMWLTLLRNELQPLQRAVVYQAFGHVKCDTTEHQYVYGLLKEALKMPNNHLKGKSFFVGSHLTLVDIFFTLIQQELQQAVLDTNYRNSMSNINAHFKMMAAEGAIKRRLGNLK